MTARSHCAPAPAGLPILGHSFALLRDPVRFFETAGRHGPIVRVRLGPLGFYLVNAPEIAQQILVDTDAFERGRFFDRARRIIDAGAIGADGPRHHRRRVDIQPAFGRTAVRGYIPGIIEEAEQLTRGWRSGDTIDLDESLTRFVSRTMLRCMYGADLSTAALEDLSSLSETTRMLISLIPARTLTPAFFTRLPTSGNRRFKKQYAQLLSSNQELIRVRRADGAPRDDILSRLMTAPNPDTGLPMTEAQIHGEVLGILSAGIEAPTTTLAWAFHELAHHPDAAPRVRAEADAVLGCQPDQGQIKQLAFTHRVLREVMRLHSALLFTRRTRRKVTLAGVQLAPGAELGYSLYALHRNPALHPDPLRFNPDRPDSDPGLRKISYMPFGAGTHRCIGEHLSMTMMTLTLASVLSRWTFRAAPGAPIREVFGQIPRPSHLKMVVEPRIPEGDCEINGVTPETEEAPPAAI
ncbi:MAG: cytochrome P450 [Pseudonocardiaceae bacterium]